MTIFDKLLAVTTMPELDALRMECVQAMDTEAAAGRDPTIVQKAFIKAKNKLQRVPLRERSW